MKRLKGISEVINYQGKELPFEDKWLDLIGKPEKTGVWIVWGESGQGKTTFCLQLARYLTRFGKVFYNSIEMGTKSAMSGYLRRAGMQDVRKGLMFVDKISMVELRKILDNKRRGIDFVIIDSLQFCGLNPKQIENLSTSHPDRIFIYISHGDGEKPKGGLGEEIMYLSDVKIQIRAGAAYVHTTRYEGSNGQPMEFFE